MFQNKKRMFCAVANTLAVLLSRSANGVFLVAMIWVLFIVTKTKRRTNIRQIVMIALTAVVLVIFVWRTDFIQEAWERVLTVNVRTSATTGNQRFLQGFAIYEQLPAWAKVIGIGYGNLEGYLLEKNVQTAFLSDVGNEYMNGFSTVLVSGGIVGLIGYLAIWLWMFFEYRAPVSRMAWLVITVLMCTSAMFYSPGLLMYLVFIRIGACQMQERRYSIQGYVQQAYSYGRTNAVIRQQEGYVNER